MPRKSKKGTSASKKETPEKARRSSRRRRKSGSEAEDSGSDKSTEEHRDDARKDDPAGNNDGAKGEESGSSDGAWQVRSENGNKGGIPKLKLCLHRPPELPSPTSDPVPSPRTRRSRRGASPAPKLEENDTALIKLPEEDVKLPSSTSIKKAEVVSGDQIQPESQFDQASQDGATKEHAPKVINDQETELSAGEKKCDVATDHLSNERKEEDTPRKLEQTQIKKDAQQREAGVSDKVEREEEQEHLVEKDQDTRESKKTLAVEEKKRRRRSSTRDSSEERAKEAALKSRRFNKKEGSEDGEVVDNSDIDIQTRVGGRIKTLTVSHQKSEARQSEETVAPVVRKRRWGSSASKTATKSILSISTDVLKEIIPEAKPVALSEVHLSPNGETAIEEGEVESPGRRDSRSDERPRAQFGRKRDAPSDESEKDYEEEGVESGGEDMVQKRTTEALRQRREPVPIKIEAPVRKVASFPKDPIVMPKSPSPARNPPSCVLYVTHLVRPFTLPQLRELLARTGNITGDDGFWIDKIKSRCLVRYATEDEAKITRHALHGVRWPASNPKNLCVEFATEAALKTALVEGQTPPVVNREVKRQHREEAQERTVERKREVEREPVKDRIKENEKDKNRARERDRERVVERKHNKDGKVEAEPLKRMVRKVTIPVREWDLGKNERGFSPPPPDSIRRHGERDLDDGRRGRDKDRGRRSPSEEPVRKVKRRSEDGPTKMLLDDLFRKTKATPAIYWLPLTSEQIAVREEMRRRHMAEHEKRITEMRKKHEGKRRRRSGSKSRSRSPKK